MSQEGDVGAARSSFLESRFNNLEYLLKKRFEWMNQYLDGKEKILELGSGAGFSPLYIKSKNLKLSDVEKRLWTHVVIDALDTKLPDASQDVIICSHMIHHLAQPLIFLDEMSRVLKPGGMLIIQEINTSWFMRLILYVMKHEGWSYDINVFDRKQICNDSRDPWSANCAIPELLFESKERFERSVPAFRIEKNTLSEVLLFPLSGGVIARSRFIPELPMFALKIVDLIDSILVKTMPGLFASGRSVVLVRR